MRLPMKRTEKLEKEKKKGKRVLRNKVSFVEPYGSQWGSGPARLSG